MDAIVDQLILGRFLADPGRLLVDSGRSWQIPKGLKYRPWEVTGVISGAILNPNGRI